MILQKLSLINYKNFDSKSFEFASKINCFVGNNGIGKTNILDAIYHLGFGKSYFNTIASQNVRHGEDFYVIEGNFQKDGREEHIFCSLKKGQKKVIKRNGKAYDKFSEHLGLLPVVIISPADRDLITEGSEFRRKFMDSVISQSNKPYLAQLINYHKVLSQRNSLLKYFALNSTFDPTTLEIYNQQLEGYGNSIYETRKSFLAEFIPIFKSRYEAISGGKEDVDIVYDSDLHSADLMTLLNEQLPKDRALHYTRAGIHKDDLRFEINGYPVKKFGSQGQQKSFLIALKLAQFEVIKQLTQTDPILLLDDIFDKLDQHRVAHIVSLVANNSFGQLFISDTHADRTEEVVKQTQQSYELFKI